MTPADTEMPGQDSIATPASDEAGPGMLSVPSLLDNIEEVVACTALVIVVAAVAWGVLTRYITEQAAPWTGEIAAMGFAWIVFAGAAAGFKRGLHVSIDLLTRRLPGGLGKPLMVVVELGVLAFAVYVTWLGILFTIHNWDNPSSVLRLPLSIIYASVAFGFASIGLRQAIRLWRDFGGAR